ncbi:MAG: hypothetical protein R3E12_06060 [Candidatus Eisenbacteria bacterium]
MSRGPATLLAAIVLLLPFIANLGILVSLLFLGLPPRVLPIRARRALAPVATTWIAIVGPVLVLSTPWWSPKPDGKDADLIAAAQQLPTSPAVRSQVQRWMQHEANPSAAHYLEGLARKVERDP